MMVKKSGKHIYGAELTNAERKALDMETRRQLAEYTRKHILEVEATVIRNLRRATDWDDDKLHAFYDDFDDNLDELVKYYEMTDDDTEWLCKRELREEGIDIEQWHRERHPNEKYIVGE